MAGANRPASAPGPGGGGLTTTAVATPVAELGADDARRLALAAQGLLGPRLRGGPLGVLRHLGAVQLDTIATLARSHELVPYSRLGAVGRPAVERAYWGRPHHAFEYWAHAACVLPLELWPWCAARRRRHRRLGVWYRADPAVCESVVDRLRAEGPRTASELGGARSGGTWWSWSPVKIALEDLLARGDVVCVERRGWRRVYDLPERAVPAPLLAAEPPDEACHAELLRRAAARLGVGTLGDLAEYYRVPVAGARAGVEQAGLVEVRVQGWTQRAWADPALLAAGAAGRLGRRHRTSLLTPFDPLLWDRRRTARIFGFTHRLEAYTPSHAREHGYFAMPLLAGGRLVGRVDPARQGTTLLARRLSCEHRAVEAMADALVEAASWVGCDSVALGAVEPVTLAAPLSAALRRRGAAAG